jgi:hypothetical protein
MEVAGVVCHGGKSDYGQGKREGESVRVITAHNVITAFGLVYWAMFFGAFICEPDILIRSMLLVLGLTWVWAIWKSNKWGDPYLLRGKDAERFIGSMNHVSDNPMSKAEIDRTMANYREIKAMENF